MDIGERIRQIRKEKNMSIIDLANLTDLSKSTISEIENGKKKPAFDTLKKLASALNVPMAKLLDENEEDETILGISKSEKLVKSLQRAKNQPKEVLDDLADFIEIILEKEERKNK
ncbi:helix-turn-helix domain-containing protein [Caloramator australicus]|uniref:Helix-turn-helix motif n=1 Tax=Caloramator australicus RC3 TaxID=857293 RepID=I7LG44_9CLOT|nr:helix-turn-helix transcriptional regulator [Caloramator australicus]CCJ32985.1 Helix-turn-helix motif [Caloramator australicus RC3]